jgi:hypothetical protein
VGGSERPIEKGEADMASEIQFPATLPGSTSFDAWAVDNNGAPGNVLEARLPFTIEVKWSVSPAIALILGGDWEVKAYAEALGPGPELQLGATVIVPVNGGTQYSAVITVPPGTLPDLDPTLPNPPTSGAYKIVVLLSHRNFGSYTDVSAIVELPVVRIG